MGLISCEKVEGTVYFTKKASKLRYQDIKRWLMNWQEKYAKT
jgi:hypothetical protein